MVKSLMGVRTWILYAPDDQLEAALQLSIDNASLGLVDHWIDNVTHEACFVGYAPGRGQFGP